QSSPGGLELRARWGIRPVLVPSRLSRQRRRRRGIPRGAGAYSASAGSPCDSPRDRHLGFRQGHGGASQYRVAERGGSRLDLGAALEPSPGGIPPASGGRLARLQQRPAGRASGGGKVAGAWGGISVRVEILRHLCRRATPQRVGLVEQGLDRTQALGGGDGAPGYSPNPTGDLGQDPPLAAAHIPLRVGPLYHSVLK